MKEVRCGTGGTCVFVAHFLCLGDSFRGDPLPGSVSGKPVPVSGQASGSAATWQPIWASGSARAWGLTREPLPSTSRAFSTSAGTALTRGPQRSAKVPPSCPQGPGLPRFPSTQGPEMWMPASQVCILVTRPFFGHCA